MHKQILLYKGEGANLRCLRTLTSQLRGLPIQLVGPQDLTSAWETQTSLLIFPGGRDIPYHNTLKGPPNARIRAFVEQGGHYLGICAGGYYGSQKVEFERNHPLEVLGDRELAFFPGTASGPAYGPGQFRYDSEAGAKTASLVLTSGEKSTAYFNGGCAFLHAEVHPHISILARYEDIARNPAAIVECRVGKGLAVLSGVHPEYPLTNCPVSEQQRKKLFSFLLARLGLYDTL